MHCSYVQPHSIGLSLSASYCSDDDNSYYVIEKIDQYLESKGIAISLDNIYLPSYIYMIMYVLLFTYTYRLSNSFNYCSYKMWLAIRS